MGSLSFKDAKIAIDIIVKSGHVPNLVGLQGIGKTDLVNLYAKENNYPFTEITCSLLQEGDLAMPYSDGNGGIKYAINNIIQDINKKAETAELAILFLDEFNRPSSQVQSELMNLVLQRSILGYKLRDNVRIILAMNPSSEMEGYENTNYNVSFSDKAILGRVDSIDLVPRLTDWLDYGSQTVTVGGTTRTVVHSAVRDFLVSQTKLFCTPEREIGINNTPRGWSRVSDILYSYEDMGINNQKILLSMVGGTVEKSSASLFLTYYKSCRKNTNYSSIARKTLIADSMDDWDANLFSFSDPELDKVFKFMLQYVSSPIKSIERDNIVNFIMADMEMAYSWVKFIQKTDESLYDSLLENSSFSEFVLKLVKTNVNKGRSDIFVNK